jgi:hypothetical protein
MPVLNSLEDIPEDATYYPSYWKGNLDKQITEDFLNEHVNDNLKLNIISKPFDADVVVYTCNGHRELYSDSTFFGDVFRVIDPRILTKVRQHYNAYPVSSSWGIHIRGTDRLRDRRRLMSIQSIVSNVTSNGGMNKSNMVVVSDDNEHTKIWKNYYPNSYVVSNFHKDSRKGNHNMNKDELTISKDQLNVEMLSDGEKNLLTLSGDLARRLAIANPGLSDPLQGEGIVLIDEIHTPDSSRYFYADGYQERQNNNEEQKQLSKEFVRRWLIENGFQGQEGQQIPYMTDEYIETVSDRYIELFENIIGESFVKADITQIQERIEKNVLRYLENS